jgi:phosphomannomutase
MPGADGTASPLMVSVSGCRGIVGESLTPEVVVRFAGAFGGYLADRWGARGSWGGGAGGGGPLVVLARDGRAGGRMVRDAAVAGLCAAGCRVIDLGVAMTPTAGVMTDYHAADGALVVTASHNPQEWNGLKCIVRPRGLRSGETAACAPAAEVAGRIIERFREGRVGLVGWRGVGTVEPEPMGVSVHVGRVLRAIGDVASIARRRMTVVLDSVNASGVHAGAALLEALGCRTVHLGDRDSGVFPHAPEPLREHLGGLCEAVREHRAAAGFAQDPDGDRLAVVDERGEYIGEEYTLALAALEVLSSRAARGGRGASREGPPVLAANLSTSRMIDEVASRWGGAGARVARAAVGEANVVEAMRREAEGCLLGGEGNGGVIWPEVAYIRDSLSAMALVLRLLARDGRPLSRIVAEALPASAMEKRKVELKRREDAERAVEAVARAYAGERLDRQDGVRVDFDRRCAWLHVRASNTEPIMRLIAEAPSAAEARAILDEAAAIVAKGRR